MSFIKQIRKTTRSAPKVSNVKKVLDSIRYKIADAAEDGETSVEIDSRTSLTLAEEGRVVGTLKRQGFKIKSGYDYESQSYVCSFIVSWK